MRRALLSLLLGRLAGCGRDEVSAAAPLAQPPPAASHRAVVEVIHEPDAPMPSPRRGRLGEAIEQNAACVACHEGEAVEWRASRHRQANTNAAYVKSFATEPSSFCRGCHAPEAEPTRSPPRAVSELGVGCVTCHVTGPGVVLAAPAEAGAPETAPHPIRRSADFATTGGCAGCHEFRFPVARGDDDARFMQTTLREHQRSPFRDTPCAGCHMPPAGPRRSHSFDQIRDPAWLRDRLRATATQLDDHTLRVTLTQSAPGHGFPTGDLFRRLVVGAEFRGLPAARASQGPLIGRDARYLTRHFTIEPTLPDRTLRFDDRVFHEPVEVDLAWEAPAAAPTAGTISWWVHLQRVATVGQGSDPTRAIVESEVAIHRGSLPFSPVP